MLRVRFHGRGGHGVKTASRILGTAAFLRGFHAQDSPIYGAERRGAAVAAFTRIDTEPIRERGLIADPDLLLVADESLLDDPSAGVLNGREGLSALFINSQRSTSDLLEKHPLTCSVLTLDLTSRTGTLLGRRTALSAPLGAAACALAGIPLETTLKAVREELHELGLSPELIEKNVELAREVHASLPSLAKWEHPVVSSSPAMHQPTYVPSSGGIPIIQAAGNAVVRHTGSWRVGKPVIDREACTRCGICFVRCPDSAIHLDHESYPVIDYDNCKGCMICKEECPLHCIAEEKEVRAW